MPMKIKEVEEATMQLSLEERAQLAGKILLSLDEPTESEVERLWLDEAERRLNEFRKGKTNGTPAEEVFRRAIAELA
ncbi:MAG TPA: addiction module antitoxin RelB [Geobacter sp.]|nr:addiction module antitoxin RelB [Geobacter sp.]